MSVARSNTRLCPGGAASARLQGVRGAFGPRGPAHFEGETRHVEGRLGGGGQCSTRAAVPGGLPLLANARIWGYRPGVRARTIRSEKAMGATSAR